MARPAALLAASLLIAVAACAEQDRAAAPTSPPTTATTAAPATSSPAPPPAPDPGLPGGSLPPPDLDALAAAFDPLVAPLGYAVERAALIDRGTYRPDPSGTHLAVYVAPVDEAGPERIATDFLPLLRVFLPLVFDQWPGLESFDVCQEPHAWEGDGDPPSLTLVDVHRATTRDVDWASLTVPGLERLADERAGISLWVTPEVRDTGAWNALGAGAP